MGDSVEQWRATIGQWSGGRPRNSVTLQHHIAQNSNYIGYGLVRFLVLMSLLVIGCVELNPGPNNETSGPTGSTGAVPKYRKRTGTVENSGKLYEVKMAAFLFARALNNTEEFQLASNVDGAGAFDDLVFRYRLRESDVCKTCFIQLKYYEKCGKIERSRLTKISDDFSLFKYFRSYCEIKNNATTNSTLKECGHFVDFEFVIYTNGNMENSFTLQGGDSDPVRILNSGTDYGKYITFVEKRDTDNFNKISDKDVFKFFEELSAYHELIREVDSLLLMGTSEDEDINLKIQNFKNSVSNKAIKGRLKSLKSNLNKGYVTRLINELSKCDFKLYKDFLSKVKIFHSQSDIDPLKELTEKELQEACKATPLVARFIYPKFEEEFSRWWKRNGDVEWLIENSKLWQNVQKYITGEINVKSEPIIQEIDGCSVRFNQQHVQKLSDVIEQNTVLNIVTNSKNLILQKLKTCQALTNLGYRNSLFICIKSLINRRKEIKNLWPCKWCDVMVVVCDTDGNVTHRVLDILQQSADCEEGIDISDDNTVETFVEVLQELQQKLILISTREETSGFQEKLRNVSYFEDNCNISDFDEKSQNQILERPVNFQGTKVTFLTLVGTDPPERIKALLDSEVISILLTNKHELSVGRELSDRCKYYVPRVLQHHIYLKEDILKLTDKAITFVVSGLQADELKTFLPAGEKICEFVYDERERNYTFKIVSDLSNIGLGAECATVMPDQKEGIKMKSDDLRYNILGNKNSAIKGSEGSKVNSFSTVGTFSNSAFSDEAENRKTYNEAVEIINPEEVRYIILGNTNPDTEFREIKMRFRNVQWIHVENRSFLWRDCNIDIIRRYIDKTKYEKCSMKCLVEHNDRTMLLVAEPGMGKSTFLSNMALEIKKLKPSVWVLRINLNEYTNELDDTDFKQECIDKCKKLLWSVAHSPEQDALKVAKEVFFQAMEQAGKMVIILDGYDEISTDYSDKVKMLIRVIRDETASKIWISSRLSCRLELENIVGKLPFTLQPFTPENQTQFLVQYWSEGSEMYNEVKMQMFAKQILSLCSQTFSDKDGKFTGIPLQTMMLGEAFVNEAKEYYCSGEINLPEKFNLLSLFKKFTEKKFDIYFREKNKMCTSKPLAKRDKRDCVERHMISALQHLFSPNEFNGLLGAITENNLEQAKLFLREGNAQEFGIISDTMDGKLQFIHRCFAEYFAAKWLTDNFKGCEEFISNFLFNSTYEVTRNIFDQILAEDFKVHGSVLNNDTHVLKEILKMRGDLNALDKGGRTALHVAASYNSPYIQQLLSFSGTDVNKPDRVLEWTPLRYADRTKSWMAMDILLQNGAKFDDIVFTRHNAKTQEWGQRALWECASKGHEKLLEFILSCGIEVNANVEVPENFREQFTLLHRASCCGEAGIVRFLVNRGADIKMVDANNNTALHLAAVSGSVDIIKLILEKRISVNLCGAHNFTPLHFSAQFGHLEATKTLVERRAAINATNIFGYTPLMLALYSSKLEIFRYLIEIGANIDIPEANNDTVLHLASKWGSVDFIKILLDKGISVNVRGSYKCTPLHITAQCGHLEATKALVERGADINNTNKYDFTPLMLADLYGKLEIRRYLTELGADNNIRNAIEETALHKAAECGSVKIIKFLLDKGMSVNMTNMDGFAPLHAYAKFGHLEATKALVERGAAINNINKHGVTPLMLAAFHGKLEICRYLTELGADTNIRNENRETALHGAAVSGTVEIIKFLLDKGMSVNLASKDGFTPLYVSVAFGHLEATKALVERGAAINKINKHGITPLMTAALHGRLEIFRYLTELGTDTNICNANRETALHGAAVSGSVEIIKFLLDKGMSVNLANKDGFTPLHVSAQFGHLEASKVLFERGASLNIVNKYGCTPLMMARGTGVINFLTEAANYINKMPINLTNT